MMGRLPLATVLFAALFVAFGQGAPAVPSFAVASVKPATRITSSERIKMASSDPDQISGPDWLGSEHYNVAARLPGNAPKEQVPLMLLALPAERFKLALHHERKELQGYALAVGKSGFKLKPVDDPPAGIHLQFGGALRGTGGKLTLPGLANAAAGFIGSPVEDATGIAGTFAAREGNSVPNARGPAAGTPEAPSGPSLFTAVQNLGLKLEPRNPIDILAIDRTGKTPTEN